MTFFNTTDESGDDLWRAIYKAGTQNHKILEVFHETKTAWTASLLLKLRFPQYPITSIRRALNTLERDGHIERTGAKRKGMYDRNEYVYKLVSKQLNLF